MNSQRARFCRAHWVTLNSFPPQLKLSGTHKVREGYLAWELHGWNNSNVFLKGVICTCKCVTEEYTERSLQGSVINFSLLGNGEPANASTKRKMDINLTINPIFTAFFTFIFNKPQCCGQDCISLTPLHWNLMKQISSCVNLVATTLTCHKINLCKSWFSQFSI